MDIMDIDEAVRLASYFDRKTNWRSVGDQNEHGLYGVCFSDLFGMVEGLSENDFNQMIALLKYYKSASEQNRMAILRAH